MNSSVCNQKVLGFFLLEHPAPSSETSNNVAGEIGLFRGFYGPGPTKVKIPALVLMLLSGSV